jgi:hypothetical protein
MIWSDPVRVDTKYVGLYLTTDTDAWTKDLGVDLRLRSAALSDSLRRACARRSSG